MAGLILAGGEGRRIGGKKPQRLLSGISLLDHVRRQAQRDCRPIYLSVRDIEDAPSGSGLPLVEDAPDLAGPLAGIVTGAEAARAAGAARMCIYACDCPFLPRDLVPRLSAALDDNPAAGMAASASGGRIHPAVSIIRLDRHDDMRQVAAQHSRLMALFDALGGVAVEWPVVDTEAGPLDPFFNVNSKEDLDTAEKLYPIWTLRQKSTV